MICSFPSSTSDLVSFSEGNTPAPPSGRRQLPAPQTQAPVRPPSCSPHEEVGSYPQTSLQAEPGVKRQPAAVRRRSLWSGPGPLHSHELLVGRGGGQPAGAAETRLVGSDGTAAAATAAGNATSSNAAPRRFPTSAAVRSPSAARGHSPHSSRHRPA